MNNRVGSVSLVLFAAVARLTVPVAAQDESPQQAPVAERHAALVAALNTGDPVTIGRFVRAHHEPGANVDREIWYWTALHREVGPLQLVGTETERIGGRERDVYWYRGTVTGAWVGIDLRLERGASWRIAGRGVRRGVRPALAPPPIAVSGPALRDSLAGWLNASAAGGHFSGAVVVARNGRTVFEGAYGFADHEAGVANTLETPFHLASVAKMFTGVAIAQLAERGVMSIDSPISAYIVEYPSHIGRQVTVRHLLTHTSGIELDDDAAYNAALRETRSVQQLLQTQLDHIERLNLGNYDDFAPLERFDYTNEGIDLLGVIVERVSGLPWGEYLRQHVLAPAGMTRTGTDYLTQVPDLALAYELVREPAPGEAPGARRPAAPVWMIRPAGTGYSTAPDMLRFVQALQNNGILGREWVARATTMQVEIPTPPGLGVRRGYGFTFGITELEGGSTAVGHTGGAPGMSTVVEWYPELGYVVIVLANFDRAAWWVNLRIREMIGAY